MSIRSRNRLRSLSEVFCVRIVCPSASDCPNKAVKYNVYSTGLAVAFRRFLTLLYEIIDDMECTCNLVRIPLFDSFVKCAGDRAIVRIILVCVASILCSCASVSMCASRA